MSEHTKGNNPIAPGTKLSSAWMEYIEDYIDNFIAGSGSPKTYVHCAQPATPQSIPNNTLTVVDFDLVTAFPSSVWNESSNIFTVPEDGYYNVSANILWDSTFNGLQSCAVYVYRSGGNVVLLDSANTNQAIPVGATCLTCGASAVVYLVKNDTLQCIVKQTNAGGGAVSLLGSIGGTHLSSFTIYQVGTDI
jgi:hypothetical protein